MSSERKKLLLACVATLALLVPVGLLWFRSLVPSEYSVQSMGYADYGGGPHGTGMTMRADMDMGAHDGSSGTTSVDDLVVDPARRADVSFDLVARQEQVRLASGEAIDGFTVNGRSPGPQLDVTRGQLVEVHLTNEDVDAGVTLHWHGLDVPNAEDGVAGVTQDAVRPGASYTYRFVADQAGTFWYHSHQVSHDQVVRGLLGAIVVHPRHPDPAVIDVTALSHLFGGTQTLNGDPGPMRVEARPGQRVRVRAINTDNGPTRVWSSAPYEVVAVDGTDVNRPTRVEQHDVVLTAGGRVDVEVTAPADGTGVRLQVGSSGAVLVGPAGVDVPAPADPDRALDLLSYGSPAPLGFDPTDASRHFTYDIGRRPWFVRGRPGLQWTVNGHTFPDMPMFVVHTGDIVAMRIYNGSGDVHPMHLHGHHAVVLARNGVRATGSPWWFDSLDVEDGDTFDVAFVADNPGIWMDHCHNLRHAKQGLVTHLMYDDVAEPYRVGSHGNEPE